MRITIIAVDQRMPPWAAEACRDYLSRFPRGWRVDVKTVKEEPRRGQTEAKLMEAEAARIRKAMPPGALAVALDERGKAMTSEELASQLRAWEDSGTAAAFLIGGADGLDPALKASCPAMIRLSSMTLPHAFARVLLCEQLYRAWSILNNHPYHRA